MMLANGALAVLLRTMQWTLDEAAYEVGGGRYTASQRRDLAARLTDLASELRADTVEGELVAPQETRLTGRP